MADSKFVGMIIKGDIKGVKTYIRKNPNKIKQQNQLGQTYLMIACHKGNSEVIDLLINADFEMKDIQGNTALYYAVKSRCPQVVSALIEKGKGTIEINQTNVINQTPLMIACREGNGDVVKLLINAGAYMNMKDIDDDTALHYAVEWNNHHVVPMLIERGKGTRKLDYRGVMGRTPLHWACCHGFTGTVKLLLNYNGNCVNVVDENGDTPLHLAVQNQAYDVLTLLLSQDAVEFDCKDRNNMTPLLQAICQGHIGMIIQLIAKGAKIDATDNEGNNCLHLALKRDTFHSDLESMDILDKHCYALSLKRKDRLSSRVIASYLSKLGANFYHRNKDNMTPIDLIECPHLKDKLKTFLPPQCTYCEANPCSKFQPCGHEFLCSECYQKVDCKSCKTCKETMNKFETLKLGEDRLHRASKTIGDKWMKIGRELRIKQADLDVIKRDFPNDTVEQCFQMLYNWSQCCDRRERTLERLKEAFRANGCVDAVGCLQ